MTADTTPALTAEQALGVALSVASPHMLMEDCQKAAPDMLAHLRAMGYTVARHVRDTGCEGLREALRRHIVALGELCELVTRHEDATECGCGDFDDWFQTWDGPAQRLHVPDDLLDEARAALAAPAASPEACARDGCRHAADEHVVEVGDREAHVMCIGGFDTCPCTGYQPATASAAATSEEGGK